MQNAHFAFLEPMLKEVPLPKFSSTSDSSTTPTQLGAQQPFFSYDQQQPFLQQHPQHSHLITGMGGHFQLGQPMQQPFGDPFQQLNPPMISGGFPSSFNNFSSSLSKDDLTAKISLIKSDHSVSRSAGVDEADGEGCGKRKRGRPKKVDRKDK
jgi:hypothetical protein